jgi:hypothetical protein
MGDNHGRGKNLLAASNAATDKFIEPADKVDHEKKIDQFSESRQQQQYHQQPQHFSYEQQKQHQHYESDFNGHPLQDKPIIKNNINSHRINYGGCCSGITRHFKGSIHLAFLSHVCFVIASLFYIKLSFVQLDWIKYTMVDNDVPSDMLITDDDVSWSTWETENQGEYREPTPILERMRLTYGDEYTTWCTLGASFFVLVGALDWLRYCDKLNVFMVLAGLAGVISGYSKSTRMAAIWDCISVHLYFLESITLLKREHYYPAHVNVVNSTDDVIVNDHYHEGGGNGGSIKGARADTVYEDDVYGYPCFRVGDLFFFLGSMLDVSVLVLVLSHSSSCRVRVSFSTPNKKLNSFVRLFPLRFLLLSCICYFNHRN